MHCTGYFFNDRPTKAYIIFSSFKDNIYDVKLIVTLCNVTSMLINVLSRNGVVGYNHSELIVKCFNLPDVFL